MFRSASHFHGINYVAVPLTSTDASHSSCIGLPFFSLSWRAITCGEAYWFLETAQESCRLSRRWTRIEFPWQWETALGCIAVISAGKRPVGPFSALANSLGLTSPWVEHACACFGGSRLIPSVRKIKGGHMYSYSYTIYAPTKGAYIESILESNWLILKIYVSLYVFYFRKCVVIMPLQARLHHGLSFTSRA